MGKKTSLIEAINQTIPNLEYSRKVPIPQGCSVLKDTDIIKNVIKVQAVLKEFKTDILDIVFA